MRSFKIYGIWPQASNQTYTRTSTMQSRWCGARPNKHPAIISTILPANFKNRHRCLISWFYSMLHGAVELILRNFLNLFKSSELHQVFIWLFQKIPHYWLQCYAVLTISPLTHPILSYRFLVERTNRSSSSQHRAETLFTEEVSTFCLHWIPHRKETDGTLMPLQEWVDKFGLVARHFFSTMSLSGLELWILACDKATFCWWYKGH